MPWCVPLLLQSCTSCGLPILSLLGEWDVADLFLTHTQLLVVVLLLTTWPALPPLRCTTHAPHVLLPAAYCLLPVGSFSASVTHARALDPLF